MYTRRSTRVRQPPITFSPSTMHSETIARNTSTNAPSTYQMRVPYALNRDKAIKKKENATNREEACRIEPKKGGNIVIHLSTAAYEVVKCAMLQHFGQMSETKDIKTKTDENNAVVEHIITAYKDKSKTTKGKMYTINMYHTQSKILTNGQQPNICIDHIMKIFSEINQDEIDQLNNIIREKCKEVNGQNPRQDATTQPMAAPRLMPPSTPAITTSNPFSILQEGIEDRDAETDHADIPLCPYCNNPAQHRSIECANCSQWIHAACEGMNENEAKELEEDTNKTYTFNLCKTLTQDQTETNTSQSSSTLALTQTTTNKVGNFHLQTLQNAHTQNKAVGNSHSQNLRALPMAHIQNNAVGNSHSQNAKTLPAAHTQNNAVGNSHSRNTLAQVDTLHTTDETDPKQLMTNTEESSQPPSSNPTMAETISYQPQNTTNAQLHQSKDPSKTQT